MHLDETTKDMMAEIGNISIGWGANKIAEFTDKIVDIKLVTANLVNAEGLAAIKQTKENTQTISESLTGTVTGELILQIPEQFVDLVKDHFPKLEAEQEDQILIEFAKIFSHGFSHGMHSMTGVKIEPQANIKIQTGFDSSRCPSEAICLESQIIIKKTDFQFGVLFISKAKDTISQISKALGLEE